MCPTKDQAGLASPGLLTGHVVSHSPNSAHTPEMPALRTLWLSWEQGEGRAWGQGQVASGGKGRLQV